MKGGILLKIPAIRAKIGIWVYYVATLTFQQIAQYVKRVDDELHQSTVLREMLQRSITENYKSISKYILQQEERFFNSLVLAVYDGDPQWREVRLDYGDGNEFYDIGLLELTGGEKIFPVDGQHRVEGIKDVLKSNPEFSEEKIPVIFIGHKKDADGMQRTRRLFSTLNRYAKPVSMRDIIALDEDDSVAIASRELIDNHYLFANNRILDSKTKAIPESNTTAFTSIITFYECNKELLKSFLKDIEVKNSDNKVLHGRAKIDHFIKYRPDNDIVDKFIQFCFEYWSSFSNQLTPIKEYLETRPISAERFRNRNGGCILFRPIALVPFIRASLKIKERCNFDNDTLFFEMNKLPLNLNAKIWTGILWNPASQTMILNFKTLTELLLIYLYNKNLLKQKENTSFYYWLTAAYGVKKDQAIKQLEESV